MAAPPTKEEYDRPKRNEGDSPGLGIEADAITFVLLLLIFVRYSAACDRENMLQMVLLELYGDQ